jgi:formiminotetrahydrofolate cyclodeaminase
VDEPSYLELPLGEFLQRLSADTPAPGGGSAAALTVTFAAGLVTMVARHSRSN